MATGVRKDTSGRFTKRHKPPPRKKGLPKPEAAGCVANDHCYAGEDGCTDWREGRRVIELGVLAEGLRSCKDCGKPLQLHNCVSIEQRGLAAILRVPCQSCDLPNDIYTGKRHGKTWDVNTKLGTAMLHSGIGEVQINSILGCLNIPTVNSHTLNTRMKESGQAIEMLARETVESSLQEEVQMQGGGDIDVSVDAGWQKRGSGRSYDSLSGHCSMVGPKTGKVVGYSVRSKTCRKCDRSATAHTAEHDCRKNWIGSAKAMEPDMVEEMVEESLRKGINILSITGDDDSSTIARLRSNINTNIAKKSDKNHVKKCLGNSLYTLQKSHSALTTKVINSIKKNFSYMLAQNKGNQQGILDGLAAQSRHPFGDHSLCNTSWCRLKLNTSQTHSSLPYGKPLSDPSLQSVLESLFASYNKHAQKLSDLGSTQANESFNSSVASKAPKQHHYAGSASLSYRVSAAVAQKNLGHKYLQQVHSKIGVSPGSFTSKLSQLRDVKEAKRKAKSTTVAAKRRRSTVKQERLKKRSSNELKEGPLYQTNILVDIGEELPTTIPEATPKPVAVNMTQVPQSRIFFDLETTGLGRNEHIIQIAAKRDEESFNAYVLPKKPISTRASDITHIDVVGNQLFYKNTAVESSEIREGLLKFIDFLSRSPDNVLIGHNCKSFDCQVLYNALKCCELIETFEKHVTGFIDTRQIFNSIKPCTQQSLAKHFQLNSYNAHNAIDDVEMLRQIVAKAAPQDREMLNSSFTVIYCSEMIEYLGHVNKNLPSLQKLIDHKVLSANIARNIAGSGLSFEHLLLAYKRNGISGIGDLFSDVNSQRKVRVTNSKLVISAVSEFLSVL